ncbi:MAG: CBS domain-containing protein [Bacteroidales bacterium]
MLAKDLLSDEIPTLKTSDTALEALWIMEQSKVSQLPIVEDGRFLGLLCENDIFDLSEPGEPIGKLSLSLFSPFIGGQQHIYEAIDMMSNLKLSVLPVLDSQQLYMGSVALPKLAEYMGRLFGMQVPGGILVLEVNPFDYSLAEIARIVESNDARITSMYITSPPDTQKLEITLKINREDLTSVIRTFVRYEYLIKETHISTDKMDEIYKNRFEQFMTYLNI